LRQKVLGGTSVLNDLHLVSIENGIIPDTEGVLEDRAYIILEQFHEGYHRVLERSVKVGVVPREECAEFTAEHTRNPDLTFGDYLMRKDPSVNPADWSVAYGGSDQSREEALRVALEQMSSSISTA
jgi:hypothetical protein